MNIVFFTDVIESTLRRWEKNDEVYFETKASKAAKDAVANSQSILISGRSGSRKTAAARHIALHLRAQNYTIVPVESANDVINYRCKDTRQIFVIDDVFGKYYPDTVKVKQWEELNCKLESVFNDVEVKLVCTLRQQITESGIFSSSNTILQHKMNIIEFDNAENELSKDEKYAILQNHLIQESKEHDLSEDEKIECCKGTLAFPLHCRLFVSNETWFKSKQRFFNTPSVYLKDELTLLFHRNKELYCVLVLCMMFSGKLPIQLLDVSNDVEKENLKAEMTLAKTIIESCCLSREISREILLTNLKSVIGIYIDKSICGQYYEFIHDTLLEVVSVHFSSIKPTIFINYCDIQFLASRVRMYNQSNNNDECAIIVDECSIKELIQRFLQELRNGMFFDVLQSQPISNKIVEYITFVQIYHPLCF